MKKFLIILGIVAVLLIAALAWINLRTIDDRNAGQWLAFANDASSKVAYYAVGKTTVNGKTAAFELKQEKNGRYQMDIIGENGKHCRMGCDGEKTWYHTGDKYSAVDNLPGQDLSGVKARIINTVQIAGRAGVVLQVRGGKQVKEITIDREKGIILKMVTGKAENISRMVIDKINFDNVKLGTITVPSVVRAVSAAEVKKLLGHNSIKPAWMPAGMKLRGEYLDWCDCCQRNMVVTSYSDGVSAVTLFQMTGKHMCAMESGCHMAPTGQSLIETRIIDKTTVVAVADIDKKSFTKILDSLDLSGQVY